MNLLRGKLRKYINRFRPFLMMLNFQHLLHSEENFASNVFYFLFQNEKKMNSLF